VVAWLKYLSEKSLGHCGVDPSTIESSKNGYKLNIIVTLKLI
jgi:hypothetical protein